MKQLLHYHYFKTIMISGLIKSVIGTLLMSIGATILVNYSIQPGEFASHTPLLSGILIIGGILVYFFGDIYKAYREHENEKKMREEQIQRLELLEKNLCEDIRQLAGCKNGSCEKEGYCFDEMDKHDQMQDE